MTLAAFSDIYTAQYGPLVRLAYLTTGSMQAAEDVVQDALVELYRNWSEGHALMFSPQRPRRSRR